VYTKVNIDVCSRNISPLIAYYFFLHEVETIGDSYMCSTGCPVSEDPFKAAVRMALLAGDMIKEVQAFQPSYLPAGFRIDVRGAPETILSSCHSINEYLLSFWFSCCLQLVCILVL
jgi:hypothetical protein